MFEKRHEPILPQNAFVLRLLQHTLLALGIAAGSLVLGVAGYHYLGQLGWSDSLVNASMLLGGMGPVNAVSTLPGKLFISFYALYAGLIFLILAGVLLAPILHRFLHHFHLEMEAEDAEQEQAG
jgi:hypothetical protein